MSKNLSGIFTIEIDGADRDLKCNFGVVEALERAVFKRPITKVIDEIVNGEVYISELCDTILTGLKANNDTRFTRDQIGEEIQKRGIGKYAAFYLDYLSYSVFGEDALIESVPDKKK